MAAHALVGPRGRRADGRRGRPVTGPLVRRWTRRRPRLTIANGGARATTLTVTAFGVPEGPNRRAATAMPSRAATTRWTARRCRRCRHRSRHAAGDGARGHALRQWRGAADGGRPAARRVRDRQPQPAARGAGRRWPTGWIPEPGTPNSGRPLPGGGGPARQCAFRLAYVVRAVSPGTFHHPAASVEDMYRPDLPRPDRGGPRDRDGMMRARLSRWRGPVAGAAARDAGDAWVDATVLPVLGWKPRSRCWPATAALARLYGGRWPLAAGA
jgi:alpha-2-macroglobulin